MMGRQGVGRFSIAKSIVAEPVSEQNNSQSHTPFDRRHRWLLAVLAVAFALRVAACWHWRAELATDRDSYLAIAESLRTGGGFSTDGQTPTAFRPPLYPLMLAVVLPIGEVGIAVFQLLLGTATVWLTFLIGRNLGHSLLGLLAAGVVAVDPLLLHYTPQLMTETLFTFLATLLLVQIVRSQPDPESRSVTRSLGIGVTFGLCALCRPTIWAFGGIVTVVWLMSCLRNRKPGYSRKNAAVLTAALLITIAPWVVRNTVVFGRPILMTTHGGYTLLLGNNPVFYKEVVRQPSGTVWSGDSLKRWQRSLEVDMQREESPPKTETARDRWMFNRAVGNIRADPSGFAAACWLRLQRFWNITPSGDTDMPLFFVWIIGLYYSLIFVPAAIGMWRLDRTAWQRWWPCAVLLISITAVHLLYWSNTRMRAPLVPVIALLAARGGLGVRDKE